MYQSIKAPWGNSCCDFGAMCCTIQIKTELKLKLKLKKNKKKKTETAVVCAGNVV